MPGLKQISYWEVPFWLVFLYWSLMPSRFAFHVEVSEVSVDVRDLCLIALTLLYACPILYRRLHSRNPLTESGQLLGATLAFVVYAVISIAWSAIEHADAKAMLVTLLLFTASVVPSFCLVHLLRPWQLHPFIRRTAIVLAVISAAYSADSFFQLGLKTPGMVREEWDFGIQRVGGPLFGSSTGYFILVPALACLLQDLAGKRGRKSITLISVAPIGITLFALGSRGGMLVVTCFVAFCVLFVRDAKKKILACAFTALVLCLAAILILQRGEIARVQSFEDRMRATFHKDAWYRVQTRDVLENIFGTGYGSSWPWYRLDQYVSLKRFNMSVSTRDGWLVAGRYQYHPHSVFILVCIELGLVGFLYFTYVLYALWRIVQRQHASNDQVILSCGLLASGVSLFLDLFLFYRPRMAVVWWIWVFAATRTAQYAQARAYLFRKLHVDWIEAVRDRVPVQ